MCTRKHKYIIVKARNLAENRQHIEGWLIGGSITALELVFIAVKGATILKISSQH